MSGDVLWTIVAAVVMVVGLCGVVVPIVPGLALIWVAALLHGFLVGFTAFGIGVLVVMTVLLATSLVLGFVIPRKAASESGASGWSQLGAMAGAIAGFFLIPFVGVIVGALLGLLAVEMSIKGNWPDAWAATKATAKGFGVSALIDFGIGTVMIALWSLWAATVIF